MSGFPDHFSAVAADYASHRPTYPAALFDWLAGQAPARRHVEARGDAPVTPLLDLRTGRHR